MSGQMAPPESPAGGQAGGNPSITSTPPHPSPSPHLHTSSPSPGNTVLQAPHPQQAIQFSQACNVMQQPTMIQTVAQSGLQAFSSQVPVLQQGSLGNSPYLQPLYPTTQQTQHMLLSPAGGLTIQQPTLNQGITVMQGTQGKPMDPKQVTIASVSQNAKGQVTLTTTQAGMAKMQVGQPQMVGPGNKQQIQVGQTQFVQQQGSNQQTLVISSLGHPFSGMLNAQGQVMQSASPMSQAQQQANAVNQAKAGQNQQNKFMTQGNNGPKSSPQPQHSPIQLGIQGQYRHINPGQQIITAGGQPMLGQTQILGPLQAFNAFPHGLSWTTTGQLQGSPIIQNPILIRNQHDGSVYIQSGPSQQQHTTASLQQVQQQHIQNALGQTIGGGQMQVTQSHGLTGTVLQQVQASQGQQQTHTHILQQTLQQTPQATIQLQQQPNNQSPGHIQVQQQQQQQQPQSQVVTQTVQQPQPSPVAPTAPRMQRPLQQAQSVKTVGPRTPRGIAARPLAPGNHQVVVQTQQQQQLQQTEVKQAPVQETQKEEITAENETNNQHDPTNAECKDAVAPTDPPVPIATIPPMESVVQPVTVVPVVSLPDAPETQENSASPAMAATFPVDNGDIPETHEQASEILTHIIEGYVIKEGPDPFPVSRTALLSEMIKREQANKDRKRKHDKCSADIIWPVAEGGQSPPGLDGGAHHGSEVDQAVPQEPTSATSAAASTEGSQGFLSRHPSKWNVQDVYEFISSVPGCSTYAEEFRSQEIDGEALLYLKVDHLTSTMNIKLGPAAKICAKLNQLSGEQAV